MGQSKGTAGGGYDKINTLSQGQQGLLNQTISGTNPLIQQAAQGYQQFLPGGQGGQPIINDAIRRFQQQTIPQIKNAFGSDAKGSSALNQALGASGADLQSSLMAQLAQLQQGASGGLANLAQGQQQLGLGTSAFGVAPQQSPMWQQLLQTILPIAGQVGAAALTGGASIPASIASSAASQFSKSGDSIGQGQYGRYPQPSQNYNPYTGNFR